MEGEKKLITKYSGWDNSRVVIKETNETIGFIFFKYGEPSFLPNRQILIEKSLLLEIIELMEGLEKN